MKRHESWKKVIAFVLAFTLVAGGLPANVGDYWTSGTATVASAEENTVTYIGTNGQSETTEATVMFPLAPLSAFLGM